MQNILNLWDRIRNFDPRKLTPIQIVLGLAVLIVAVWLLGQIFAFLTALVPLAVGVIALFFGYRWLSSRSENLPDASRKSKEQQTVDKAVATVKAVEAGDKTVLVDHVNDDSEANLTIKQVVNPDTGFKEPDISRLMEREEEKLKEADRVNQQVLSQIEERRRRLMNNKEE